MIVGMFWELQKPKINLYSLTMAMIRLPLVNTFVGTKYDGNIQELVMVIQTKGWDSVYNYYMSQPRIEDGRPSLLDAN
jgi:hypothetical protein